MIENDSAGIYYIFRVGLLCSRASCECSAYDGRVFDMATEPEFDPPLHPNCDCYAERIQLIRENFLDNESYNNAKRSHGAMKRSMRK